MAAFKKGDRVRVKNTRRTDGWRQPFAGYEGTVKSMDADGFVEVEVYDPREVLYRADELELLPREESEKP